MKLNRKKNQIQTGWSSMPSNDDSNACVPRATVPAGLFVAVAFFLFVGMKYLDNHAGGFSPHVYDYFTSSNELVQFVPPELRGDSARGLRVYNSSCFSCHQPDGQGKPDQVPPLAGSEWVLEPDPSRIIRIALNGVQGPIQVKGHPWNGAMPELKNSFNDDDIAAVLSYVRNSWGNNAPPVKKEQISAIRKDTADRSFQWSADELLKIQVGTR